MAPRLPLLLGLAVLAAPQVALPCTQVYLLGATSPAEGDAHPTDGELWIEYNGPSDELSITLQSADGVARPIELARVDPALLRGDLPTLVAGAAYTLSIESTLAADPMRIVRFTGGSGPATPPPAPAWSADFSFRDNVPCSNSGLYARVDIPTITGPRPVAWRVFRTSDMRALGARMAADAPLPVGFSRFVTSGLGGAFDCVTLAAMGADGALTFSAQEHCYPPRILDAGVLDSGVVPDAAAPDAAEDATVGRDAAAPDAAPPPIDAGQPADSGDPESPALGGGLDAAQSGCGCAATGRADGRGGLALGLLVGLGAYFTRRRTGRAREQSAA